jgi:hypothetical protein
MVSATVDKPSVARGGSFLPILITDLPITDY